MIYSVISVKYHCIIYFSCWIFINKNHRTQYKNTQRIISQQIYQVYNCEKFIILESGKVAPCIVVSSHVEETFTYVQKSLFSLLVIIFLFGMTSLSRYYYFCQVLQFSLNVVYWILEFKFSNYPSGRKFSKAGNRTFSRHIENCFDLIFSLDENVK